MPDDAVGRSVTSMVSRPLAAGLLLWFGSVAIVHADQSSATESPARSSHSVRRAAVQNLSSEIGAMYREHAAAHHLPGIAYGVVLDGALVVSGAEGWADLDARTPASTRTLFRIASMTKSFTAMAILQLRDRKKLDLDATAARYVPELRRLRYPTSDAPPITVRDLLQHGAGFPEDNPWGDRQLAETEAEFSAFLRGGVSFSNPAGIAYEYSNLGFALLGRIIGNVSHQSCQRYIDRQILRPLGMNHTVWDFRSAPAGTLARGYRWEEEQWKEETPLPDGAYASMGGLISSVEDFARYMIFHLDAWPPRDGAESGPLRRSSLREMHQPHGVASLNANAQRANGDPCPTTSAYAFGLAWSENCDQVVRVGHSGGLPGYGSNWRMLPKHGLAVVCLANGTYAPAGDINSRVVELILKSRQIEARPEVPSPILLERKRQLEAVLPGWLDRDVQGIFAENFFPDHPIHLLREETAKQFESIGSVTRIGPLKAENRLRGTFVIEGTTGRLEVFFTLSPENPPLIQEVRVRKPRES